MIQKIRIHTSALGREDKEILHFAAEELRKYISCATENDLMLIEHVEAYTARDGISLMLNGSDALIEAASEHEDSILIDVREGNGIITATNARASDRGLPLSKRDRLRLCPSRKKR